MRLGKLHAFTGGLGALRIHRADGASLFPLKQCAHHISFLVRCTGSRALYISVGVVTDRTRKLQRPRKTASGPAGSKPWRSRGARPPYRYRSSRSCQRTPPPSWLRPGGPWRTKTLWPIVAPPSVRVGPDLFLQAADHLRAERTEPHLHSPRSVHPSSRTPTTSIWTSLDQYSPTSKAAVTPSLR